ncbi:MAG TPA: winged helix-turn-helix transcriptional regulator [Candidatus Thermoplasmatota archaeon]|jgi:predicted transcriptional regulator|nr:winged helix-turn-helix transcriptional regulator [Candidatus Thermoplasmatota archaeon]
MYALRDERSVFTSNTRHLVYLRVTENPGASIQDVANMLGISHPTAAYHLKILQGNGLVVAMRDGNRTRFFKRSEALSQDQQRMVVAQRGEQTRRILEIVRAKPMIHRKELARLLAMPRTTVNWHVDRLIQRGLLAERRAGRYCQLFLPLQHQGPGPSPGAVPSTVPAWPPPAFSAPPPAPSAPVPATVAQERDASAAESP